MIITQNESPTNSLYFVGAHLITLIRDERFSLIDTMSLYNKAHDYFENGLSFNRFICTLDWLFIAGLIDVNKNGDIKRCF